MRSKIPLAIVVSSALILSACFDDDDNRRTVEGGDPGAVNNPPTIAGAPPANILEGQPYEFTPNASDADGDALEFTIARKPSWASFDRATGRLSGTPDAADVGNFTNIGISVSDGSDTAALNPFDISVNQIALGSATLSWLPPTQNTDGSQLDNLAGYKIYYGRSVNAMNQTVEVSNPGLTRYVVENLTPAKWHFVMTSINSQGAESPRTTTISKTIS